MFPILDGCAANKVRLLSAGRSSPLEGFKSAVMNPDYIDGNPASVGTEQTSGRWMSYESVTGDYLVLEKRADLRLKVEARLQAFLSRSVGLKWRQSGLEISITPLGDGTSYYANNEASGILQIVPLLAAIYNNEVGCIIIDEPEISLHPQYQSFIFQELQKVAGNPKIDSTKKIRYNCYSLPIND